MSGSDPDPRVGAADCGQAATLRLEDRPDAARAGRRFVEGQVLARGGAPIVDDVVLAAAELLANASQHGAPPITVRVSGTGVRLRIEVGDSSPLPPLRATHSATTMTGRGIALVDALVARWGVDRAADGGKVVWAEFDSSRATEAEVDDVDALLAAWDDDGPLTDRRFTVVLGDVPTDLLIEAKSHIDNLVREFSLAVAAHEAGEGDVPQHLAGLIETVVHGFSEARGSIKRQAVAAARRGDPRTRLTLHLPLSAADAGEAYLSALDEADEYARAARLLTLETPYDHRLFRRWYVTAVVRQLRRLAAGQEPERVIPFEDVLVTEVRRLASAHRLSHRAAGLQRVTAALARARTPEDVALVVVSEGVDALGASGGGLLVPAGDGEHIAVPGAVGYGEDLVGAMREERLDAPLPAATVLRTGEAVWLETQDERDRLFPELRGFEANTIAMCAVPLYVGERLLGSLRFSFSTRKLFDQDERDFVLALAALTAQTLQRTESYEEERQTSLDLQRALLPTDLPAVDGWELATYYSPAGQQQAGGDFYDAIPVSGGRVVAILGDVMGRGVDAAAAMAQIRSTIRAYAVHDPDPVVVFDKVDTFFTAVGFDQLVTALYFLVDPATGTVQIANAGHLAPVLVDAEGSREIPTITGTPLGVGPVRREATSITLAPGSAIVAVTDGVVERRNEDIDEGTARLLKATAHAGGRAAGAIVDQVISVATGSQAPDDDVTVLVLRRS